MHRIFMLVIKFAVIGVVVGGLVAPISASAGNGPHSCSFISPHRTGGISEMATCGKWGVRGNRTQFVRAITRSAGDPPFLSQLAH
jgi:hypothetical protein